MEFEIIIHTEGNNLSTTTFYQIVKTLQKIFEKEITKAIHDIFPQLSKTQIKKYVKSNITFYIKEFRKGSCVIALIGAITAVLCKIGYDLGIDIIKNNDDYKIMREWINGKISDSIVIRIKKALENVITLGPLILKRKNIEIHRSEKSTILKALLKLGKKFDYPTPVTSEEQIKLFIEEKKKKEKD